MAENSYAQLIDDFEKGINVLKGETLTEYIKRMGGVDYESKADGGAIGIEVLFKQKGGAVNSPKSKTIKGQDHMLAYITPNEAKKLEALGGKETMTKEGIPAYPEWDSMYGASSKASFDAGRAPKGNWSGGGGGGNNNPPVIVPKKKPPVVVPKNDNPPWYSPKQLINNPLLNFVNPKSKLGVGLGILKTIKNFQPKDEDLILSENVTLPGENLLAEVTQRDIDRKRQMKNLDFNTAKDIGVTSPGLTEFEFEGIKSGEITEPGTYVGADGGRVGLENGGTSNWWDGLTGEAKGIYDSMTAYGASDEEIQSKLQTQGLWSPDGTPDSGNTGQVTGIINQNIGDDRPYAGQVVDQTDYSFNKKDYGPGGKLEVNPEAIGMSFYDSEPGGKKDQGFIESFMGAAVPSKQFSEFKSPGTGDVLKGPAELGFMSQNIEGLPGLTREDLRSQYDNYNKFFGRPSNYAAARVPGTVGNLVNMVPYMGTIKRGAEALFGPQGDRSMQSKYSVDNAGYGQGTSRDEFGTFTGGKTLMGKTNDYVERMQNDVNFLENDFFGDIMGDTDFENLTESQITAMQKKNGFNFKKLQAYKNRIATEKINSDFAKKQAEIEAEKKAAASRAESARQYDPNVHGPNNYGLGSDGQQSYDSGQGFGINATTGGPVSNKTGRGRTDYSKGGLASMFTRRR
tara:strand:- start:1290 stop:3335 length:2046 start_codon:yes stop_codon:yes gene_type:complete